MLEIAILGLLNEQPMHGYELRKQLNATLGTFRAFSYGSLYPTLRRMKEQGLIAEDESVLEPPLGGRRGKVVYKLTVEGKERFQTLLEDDSPGAYDDERFGVRLAFFSQTDATTRLRILEGRRRRVEERRERMRTRLERTRERLDRYTVELQRHGLESVEREARWLSELIDSEHRDRRAGTPDEGVSTERPAELEQDGRFSGTGPQDSDNYQ